MQPLAQPERPLFSWGKGALHAFAAVAALGILATVGVVAAGLSPRISYQFGQAVGRDILWIFAFAFVASYGFQTRRKILGWLMLVLTVVIVGAEGVVLFQAAHGLAEGGPLTEAEQARPARDAKHGRFCQAALGVSFPDPGKAFAPATTVEKRLQSKNKAPNVANWVWESSETGERVLLQVIRGTGGSEKGFRDFAAGAKNGLAENPRVKVTDEGLRWAGGRGEQNILAALDNGVQVHLRCLSRGREGDRAPLTTCLQTFTGEGDPLGAVRNGLDVGGCGK